jgi:hypothetical protein
MSRWIGVDLDGTLAKYDHWRGLSHIGEPIPAMVARVREWLAQGLEVRIMTARMDSRRDPMAIEETREAVAAWTFKHLGVPLACTNTKDFDMEVLYDDRARQVEYNTGRLINGNDE